VRYQAIRGPKRGPDLQCTDARHATSLCAKKGPVGRRSIVRTARTVNSFNSLCRYCNTIGQNPCYAKIRYRAGVKGIGFLDLLDRRSPGSSMINSLKSINLTNSWDFVAAKKCQGAKRPHRSERRDTVCDF
jgi:hypothetical protein